MHRTGHIPYTDDPRANHAAIVTELRHALGRLDQLETNPRISGDLNMQGGSIINLGQSKLKGDAINRDEAIQNGLFVNAQGQHVAHSDIICRGNIRSRAQARDPFDLVPFQQLQALLLAFFNRMEFGTGTLTLTNGQNDNVQTGEPPRTVYTIDGPTAAFSISGLLDGHINRTGRLVVLVNPTGFPMTILDRTNGFSDATNRIATNKGWDMETQTDGVIMLCYLTSVWRVLATVL